MARREDLQFILQGLGLLAQSVQGVRAAKQAEVENERRERSRQDVNIRRALTLATNRFGKLDVTKFVKFGRLMNIPQDRLDTAAKMLVEEEAPGGDAGTGGGAKPTGRTVPEPEGGLFPLRPNEMPPAPQGAAALPLTTGAQPPSPLSAPTTTGTPLDLILGGGGKLK